MGQEIVNTAPASIYPLIIVVLALLFVGATSVVSYFMKDLKNSFEKAQGRQDEDIKEIREDLSGLKATLPHQYVLREDFIRAVSTLDRKVDLIARDVTQIAKVVGAKGGLEDCE